MFFGGGGIRLLFRLFCLMVFLLCGFCVVVFVFCFCFLFFVFVFGLGGVGVSFLGGCFCVFLKSF